MGQARLPDGTVIAFPDDFSDGEIDAVVQEEDRRLQREARVAVHRERLAALDAAGRQTPVVASPKPQLKERLLGSMVTGAVAPWALPLTTAVDVVSGGEATVPYLRELEELTAGGAIMTADVLEQARVLNEDLTPKWPQRVAGRAVETVLDALPRAMVPEIARDVAAGMQQTGSLTPETPPTRVVAEAARDVMEGTQRREEITRPIETLGQALADPRHTVLTTIGGAGPTVSMVAPGILAGLATGSAQVGAAVGTFTEAAGESGAKLREAREAGKGEREARLQARRVLLGNLGLLGPTNALEAAIAFTPVGRIPGARAITRLVVRQPWVRALGAGAAKATLDGLIEGETEMRQERITDWSETGELTWSALRDFLRPGAQSPNERQARMLGRIYGWLFGGVGAVRDAPTRLVKQHLDALRDQVAALEDAERAAGVPEGEGVAGAIKEQAAQALADRTPAPTLVPPSPEAQAAVEAAPADVSRLPEETGIPPVQPAATSAPPAPAAPAAATPTEPPAGAAAGWVAGQEPATPTPTVGDQAAKNVGRTGRALWQAAPRWLKEAAGRKRGPREQWAFGLMTDEQAVAQARLPRGLTPEAALAELQDARRRVTERLGEVASAPAPIAMASQDVAHETVLSTLRADAERLAAAAAAQGNAPEATRLRAAAARLVIQPDAVTPWQRTISRLSAGMNVRVVYWTGAPELAWTGVTVGKNVIGIAADSPVAEQVGAAAVALHELVHVTDRLTPRAHAGLVGWVSEKYPDLWASTRAQAEADYTTHGGAEITTAYLDGETLGRIAEHHGAWIWRAIADRTSVEQIARYRPPERDLVHAIQDVFTKIARSLRIPGPKIGVNERLEFARIAPLALRFAEVFETVRAVQQEAPRPGAQPQTAAPAPAAEVATPSAAPAKRPYPGHTARFRAKNPETLRAKMPAEGTGEEIIAAARAQWGDRYLGASWRHYGAGPQLEIEAKVRGQRSLVATYEAVEPAAATEPRYALEPRDPEHAARYPREFFQALPRDENIRSRFTPSGNLRFDYVDDRGLVAYLVVERASDGAGGFLAGAVHSLVEGEGLATKLYHDAARVTGGPRRGTTAYLEPMGYHLVGALEARFPWLIDPAASARDRLDARRRWGDAALDAARRRGQQDRGPDGAVRQGVERPQRLGGGAAGGGGPIQAAGRLDHRPDRLTGEAIPTGPTEPETPATPAGVGVSGEEEGKPRYALERGEALTEGRGRGLVRSLRGAERAEQRGDRGAQQRVWAKAGEEVLTAETNAPGARPSAAVGVRVPAPKSPPAAGARGSSVSPTTATATSNVIPPGSPFKTRFALRQIAREVQVNGKKRTVRVYEVSIQPEVLAQRADEAATVELRDLDHAREVNVNAERVSDWQEIYAKARRITAPTDIKKMTKDGKIRNLPIISLTKGCQRALVSVERVVNGLLPPETRVEACYGGDCWVNKQFNRMFSKFENMEVRDLQLASPELIRELVRKNRDWLNAGIFIRQGQQGDDSHLFATGLAVEWLRACREAGVTKKTVFISAGYAPVTDEQYAALRPYADMFEIHFSVSGWFHRNEILMRLAEFRAAREAGLPAVIRLVTNRDNVHGISMPNEQFALDQMEALGVRQEEVLETPFHDDATRQRSRASGLFKYICCETGYCDTCGARCMTKVRNPQASVATSWERTENSVGEEVPQQLPVLQGKVGKAPAKATRRGETRFALQEPPGAPGGVESWPEPTNVREYVVSPDGVANLGEIGHEVAAAIGRQAGPIRLRQSMDRHIARQHPELGDERRDLVVRVAGGYGQVLEGRGRRLLLVKRNGRTDLAVIELRPGEGGDYYDVVTAMVVRPDYLRGKSVLWERAQSVQPPAATVSPEGEVGPPGAISGQSSDLTENVGPEGEERKRGSRFALAQAPRRDAAAVEGDAAAARADIAAARAELEEILHTNEAGLDEQIAALRARIDAREPIQSLADQRADDLVAELDGYEGELRDLEWERGQGRRLREGARRWRREDLEGPARFALAPPVVDEEGTPLTFYRGSNAEPRQPGVREGVHAQGFWFTTNRDRAAEYSYGEGARLDAAHLRIGNPARMGPHELAETSIDDLRAQGYDGAYDITTGDWVAFSRDQVEPVPRFALAPEEENSLVRDSVRALEGSPRGGIARTSVGEGQPNPWSPELDRPGQATRLRRAGVGDERGSYFAIRQAAEEGVPPPSLLEPESRADAVRRIVLDSMIRGRRLQEGVERITGETISDKMDAYRMIENYSGRVTARLKSDVERPYLYPLRRRVGALAARLKISTDALLEGLDRFLYARHAPERNDHLYHLHEVWPRERAKAEIAKEKEYRQTQPDLYNEKRLQDLFAQVSRVGGKDPIMALARGYVAGHDAALPALRGLAAEGDVSVPDLVALRQEDQEASEQGRAAWAAIKRLQEAYWKMGGERRVALLEGWLGDPDVRDAFRAARALAYSGMTDLEAAQTIRRQEASGLVTQTQEDVTRWMPTEELARAVGEARAAAQVDPTHGRVPEYPEDTQVRIAELRKEWLDQMRARSEPNLSAVYEGPLAELADVIDRLQLQRLKILVEAGLETQETTDALGGAYTYYAPLKGQRQKGDLDEWFAARGRSVGQGFDVRGDDISRSLGRFAEAANPIVAQSFLDIESAIVRAEKNRALQALLALAEEFEGATGPTGDQLWTINPVHQRFVMDEDGEVKSLLDWNANDRENVVSVKVDGEETYIHFTDGLLARAVRNLGAEPLGSIVKLHGRLQRQLAALLTSKNPSFIPVNFVRDLGTAAITMTAEQGWSFAQAAMRNVTPALRGIMAAERAMERAARTSEEATPERIQAATHGEWQDLWKQYQRAGAQTGFSAVETIENRARSLQQQLGEMGPGTWATTKRKVRAGFEVAERINMAVENAIRLAAFKQCLESGMTELKAASYARNVTVNFNRRGELGSWLNNLYMFANASLQGAYRLGQVVKRHPWAMGKMMGGMVMLGYVMGMWNRAAGGEDPDDGRDEWERVSSVIKERNLIIMSPGGSGLPHAKIPLPIGLNLPVVLGYHLEQLVNDKLSGRRPRTGRSALQIAAAVANAFNPLSGDWLTSPIPTALDVPVQLAANRNAFGGPIYPSPSPGDVRPDSERYYPGARPTSIALAKWVNKATGGDRFQPGLVDFSPESIDFLIDSWGGGVVQMTKQITDLGTIAATGQPFNVRTLPIASRFVGQVDDRTVAEEYQEARRELDRLEQRRAAARKGDQSAMAGVDDEDRRLLSARSSLAKMEKLVTEARHAGNREEQMRLEKRYLQMFNRLVAPGGGQ